MTCRLAIVTGCLLWAVMVAQQPAIEPRELAGWLADRRIPAGFVLPHEDFTRDRKGSGTQEGLGDVATERVLRRFRAEHPTLVVGVTHGGTVHVVHLDEPPFIARLLQREHHLDEPVSTEAGHVLQRVLPDLVALELRAWGGAVPGTESPAGFCPLGERVSLASGATTVRSILDAVVAQQPGLVWFLTYDAGLPERHVTIGLMCLTEEATSLEFGTRFLRGPLLLPSPPPPPTPKP
jgi:hypothetical protein